MSRVVLLFFVLVSQAFFSSDRPDKPSDPRALPIQEEKTTIGFKWGFGALVKSDGVQRLVPILRDTVLRTGDELKMVVELQRQCFVYLVYQNSTGEISLLFPYDLQQFARDYSIGKKYYVPSGRSWFALEAPTGIERFFLIASAERLTDLESRLMQYDIAAGPRRAEIADEIVEEIRNLRKRFKTFAVLAERPTSIGGNVRGDFDVAGAVRPDVAKIALEISAHNFYSKTYTVEHRP